MNSNRRKDKSQPTTERETSQLRELLGGISWHARQPYEEKQELVLVTWVDVAHGNRIDSGSTQGIFLGMNTRELAEDQAVSPIAWHSQRIGRWIGRGTGGSEW